MRSCLYEGFVRHRRYRPRPHAFRNTLYMLYLDLDEIDRVFEGRWLWSSRRPALARFRRRDYLGDPARPLADEVRDAAWRATGTRPRGPIRMLTQVSHFGYCFNPVTFYYCFDEADRAPETILAEITNTPWKERHRYVLKGPPGQPHRFRKEFHVSPFQPMDLDYTWRFGAPGRHLCVHMENRDAEGLLFDATLAMRRREIGGASLARALLRHPFMTAQTSLAIHAHALRLWLKRVPFHVHPRKRTA